MRKLITGVISGERGNVLVTALLLVFATSIIGATLAMMAGTDLKISGNQEQSTESFFVAEAGLSEATHRLSLPNPTVVNVGGSPVNIALRDEDPYDPNWKVYITMTSNPSPVTSGSTVTAGTVQNLSGDYLDYSMSSGTDDVITIEHKWEDRNSDGVRDADEIVRYAPTEVPPENFTVGNPVDIITVTGRSGRGKRVIQAEVTQQTLIIQTLGALYTDKAVRIGGNSAFCGWNHDISMPEYTVPNACFAYHVPDEHLAGVATTGDVVQRVGAAHDIEGSPATTNTNPTNPWYTLAEALGVSQGVVNELLARADNTTIVDVLDGITYIQGDASINAGVVGHGLCYVTGDCTINGGFTYWGLIYVEGDVVITGTPWIMGSLIVKGASDFSFGAGNAGIVYSKEAIEEFVGGLMPMLTLAWRDL